MIRAEAGGLGALALLPPLPSDTVVYMHEDFFTAAKIRETLAGLLPQEKMPVLMTLDGADWDRDLSPWPAKGVFRGQDFAGGAEAYRSRLTETLIPALEETLPVRPCCRLIAGYSLAGLFALWTVLTCGRFTGAASVSGSLWYDGFLDFLREHDPFPEVKCLYLSLGDREKNAKNPRMAKVEEATGSAARILREKTGFPVPFELNPGGHFRDVPLRMAKAICYLIENTEE